MFAVFDLNDQSLLMQAADGTLFQEPGFARLSSEGIATGEIARAAAWREPQHSINQYWCQLNQTPLPGRHKWARHNADIAFAQLKKLWESTGMPQSMVILVPGNFSDTQVSLLLGMVKALPAEPLAVMDNALAACLDLNRNTLFVDLQLHQTVLSVCRFGKGTVSIDEQLVIPDLGMMPIYNRLTRHISNLMIQSFRYDPLHDSAGEQNICDHLPGWLGRLIWEEEISLALNSKQGELPFILRKKDVRDLMGERMTKMRSFIDLHRNDDLLFSQPSRLLPVMVEEYSSAKVAGQSAGIDQVLLHQRFIFQQIAGLQRVRSLALGDIQPGDVSTSPRLATHLLYRDKALPLQVPLSIRITDEDVRMANKVDNNAQLTLVIRNRTLEVVQHASGLEFSVPKDCRPGEPLLVGGHQMKLIEVLDG